MKQEGSGGTSAMEKEPGFGHMWQNPKFQDMVISLLPVASQPAPATLTEEQEPSEGPSKRQKTNPEVLQDIAASKVVLASSSNYWVTRIDRWDQQADSTKSLKLDEGRSLAVFEESIEPQDLPMVQAAVHFAYTRQPPSGIAELMQAVLLADKWAMPGYMAACLDKLASTDDVALTAQDINLIMADDLPPGVLQHPSYQLVKQACARALLHLFESPSKVYNALDNQMFLDFFHLSFAALLHWAQQDQLQVDSENSVAMLCTEWWRYNMPKTQELNEQTVQQRKQQLSSALRVHHLSISFFVDVLRQLPWFTSEHAPSALSAIQLERQLHVQRPNYGISTPLPPDWLKPPRDSADQVFSYEWEVSKRQLEQLHTDAGHSSKSLSAPKPFFWQGWWWWPGIQLRNQSSTLELMLRPWLHKTLAELMLRPWLHKTLALTRPAATTVVLEFNCFGTDGRVLLAEPEVRCLGEKATVIMNKTMFNIPQTTPRSTWYLPPAWLMPDNKLRLQVVMNALDAPLT